MSKMYYLICSSQWTCFGGDRYIDSSIKKKSADISKLQAYLHEKFLDCLENEGVVQINNVERDWDWDEHFIDDVCNNEENYDEEGEFREDKMYLKLGWPYEPKEIENELSYVALYGDDVGTFKCYIISDDDIESLD